MVPTCQLFTQRLHRYSEFQRYNIDDLYDSTLHLHQLFSSWQEPTFVMASQLTLFRDSTVSFKSTQRTFGFFLHIFPAEYAVIHVLPKRHRDFGGVVNFCLSLLSTYWVLSAYFLAVLEISVCAYYPVYTVFENAVSDSEAQEGEAGTIQLIRTACKAFEKRGDEKS